MSPARAAAFDALRAVRSGELADRAFAREAARLADRERAWARELTYGTLRLRGRLDHVIGHFASRPLGRIDADALDALRLGVYQLRWMGAVPAYAAVSETVELARRSGDRGTAGFVNGVLRAAAREPDEPGFPTDADPIARLETWGSHPRWLVERWVEQWGAAAAARLVDADNRTADLWLRPLGTPADAAAARLKAAGVRVERSAAVPGMLRLAEHTDVERALAEVPAIVQDPAAALVADAAMPVAEKVVYDACAAPGGKALALAAAAGRPRHVLAADVSVRRIARLGENARRVRAGLGALPLSVVVADARRPPVRAVDLALLDAPCTGTGTLRRHPDGRWRIGPADLVVLAALQAELLAALAEVVAPGGLLVYATCSLEPEENEAQVERFLDGFPEYRLEPVTEVDPAFVDARGFLRALPQEHGFDGSFAARLRRADAR